MDPNTFLEGMLGSLIGASLFIIRGKKPKVARVLFIIFMVALLAMGFAERLAAG